MFGASGFRNPGAKKRGIPTFGRQRSRPQTSKVLFSLFECEIQ